MNFNGQTKIQKIVRQNTPDFFVSTNYYAYKFHSYQKWMCPVVFKKGNYVRKTILKNGQKIVKDYDKAMPDFVLMNKKQMQILRNSIKNAEHGKKYDNPFIRTKGYYCEVFGEYWHSQQVTLVDREEHIFEADKVDYIPQYMQNLKGECGIDYVVCKICGCKKGSLTQHIRKQHNLSKGEYLQRYGGQIYSEKNKKSFHECSLNKWKTQKGEKR